MKIILVNTRHYYGGGDSTHTFNLATLLRSKGHEVAFFAMESERNLPDPNEDLFVHYIDFKEINQHKNIVNGIKVLLQSIYSIKARKKFKELLDRFHPDIIHLQNIHAHITPSVIFEAKKQGIPVVWTLHDYKLICPNSHFLIDVTGEICEACGKNAFYQPVIKRCKKGSLLASAMVSMEVCAHRMLRVRNRVDAFLSPSSFLREKFLERGFKGDKVLHIPNFLNENIFAYSDMNKQYILFLGKLSAIKGIRPLLDACRLAPDVKLILAGSIEPGMQAEIEGSLPSNVEYVGLKHGSELQQLIKESTCIVLPSLWYENQPYSILEAFAKGKPIIASDLGGMKELIGDSERGILVPPGDVQALAEAMQWMKNHPAEVKEIGKEAYEYVRLEHSPEYHYTKTITLYKKLIHKKN